MIARGRHATSRRRLPIGFTAAVLCLLAVAIYARQAAEGSGSSSAARIPPPVAAARTAAAAAPMGVTGPPTRSARTVARSAPVHLTIAAIGVSTALQPLGLLADGSLQAPSQWDVPGWYAGGVLPGQTGPAVIAGHVDSTRGPAVFFHLRDLGPGAKVAVTEQNGTVLSFVVDDVQAFPKNDFPSEAVYGPTPNAELRLITCTGEFDRSQRSYLSNLVVSAHLV